MEAMQPKPRKRVIPNMRVFMMRTVAMVKNSIVNIRKLSTGRSICSSALQCGGAKNGPAKLASLD
jgi:hypothetical protein